MLDTSYGTVEGQEYAIGEEVPFDSGKALVVRITDQCALFETQLKRVYIDEVYIELLTDQGETKFISIRRTIHDLPRKEGQTLRGPLPIIKYQGDGL